MLYFISLSRYYDVKYREVTCLIFFNNSEAGLGKAEFLSKKISYIRITGERWFMILFYKSQIFSFAYFYKL